MDHNQIPILSSFVNSANEESREGLFPYELSFIKPEILRDQISSDLLKSEEEKKLKFMLETTCEKLSGLMTTESFAKKMNKLGYYVSYSDTVPYGIDKIIEAATKEINQKNPNDLKVLAKWMKGFFSKFVFCSDDIIQQCHAQLHELIDDTPGLKQAFLAEVGDIVI